jgi:hypothetical protein
MSSFQQLLDLVNKCQFDAENQKTAYKKKIKHQKKMISALKKHAQQCENMCKSIKLENKHLWKMIEKQDRTPSAPEVIDLMNVDVTRPIKQEKVTVVIENEDDEVATSIVEIEEEESVEVEDEAAEEESLEEQDEEIEVEESVEEEAEEETVEETEEEVEEEAEEESVEEQDEEIEIEESVEEEAEEETVEETEEEVEVEEEVEEESVEVEEEVEEESVEVEESKEEPVDDNEDGDGDEEEVFMITIDGTDYFTTSETDGMIYAVTKDGDVGEEVGYFEEGEPGFYEE